MFPPVQATMSTLMAWEKAGVSSFYSHNSSMLATTRQELTGQRRIGAIQRLFAGIKHPKSRKLVILLALNFT